MYADGEMWGKWLTLFGPVLAEIFILRGHVRSREATGGEPDGKLMTQDQVTVFASFSRLK
jgi:hypothetical protein